jgi:hypothetical protein
MSTIEIKHAPVSTPTNRPMTTDEMVTYARDRIAEGIAAYMLGGYSHGYATKAAFTYCNRRWPTLVAAMIAAEARS